MEGERLIHNIAVGLQWFTSGYDLNICYPIVALPLVTQNDDVSHIVLLSVCIREVMWRSFPDFYEYYRSTCLSLSHLNGQTMQVSA